MSDTTFTHPTLHMIGNAHLDPVWLWRWQEGCAEAISTCWAAIDRLRENDDFIFSKGEAHIYEWIEKLEPDLFAEIQRYVAEGRWTIVNGWWIQPDCNIPSGESVIRQALYGKEYFQSKFGIDVPVGLNVDSFGHPSTFPKLLRHTGSSYYTFMRPNATELDLPAELFNWVGDDGSQVTAYRIQGAYSTSKREMPLPEKIDLNYRNSADFGHPIMCFYGVGNHGGAPTIANLTEIENRISRSENLRYSSPDIFFDEVSSPDLPQYEGALQYHAIGCYSAASNLKTLNRKAESLLEMAEAAATLATLNAHADYPKGQLERLWKTLLFNQFHDTLGGSSIEVACDDSESELRGVIADAELILNASARQLGRTIAKPVDPTDATFFVMNFNGSDNTGMVEAEPWVDKDIISPRCLLDETGQKIPFQYIDALGKTKGLQRIVFRLDIPAFGYRVLRFVVDSEDGISCPGQNIGVPLSVDNLEFESDGYALTIDSKTGAIQSLKNKKSDLEIFDGPAHLGTIVKDETDTWGHGTKQFDFDGETTELTEIKLLDAGPIRTIVEVTTKCRASVFRTSIVLPADPNVPVQLRVKLDWHEHHHLLRIAYPLGIDHFEYEVPGGWENRPDNGVEVPGQRWMRAVGRDKTVVITNDAKYSFAALDGTYHITAVRSPVFAHHDPIEVNDGGSYRFMDQGEQSFTMEVYAAPTITRAQASALAEATNKPVVVTPHVSRNGDRPHRGQWLRTKASTSAIGALKMAEDLDGAILRIVELDGEQDQLCTENGSVTIPARGIASARLRTGDISLTDGLEN